MTSPFTTPAAEIRRDRWGRALITPPGGGDPVGYTRATTIAGTLDDQYGLMGWKVRLALIGAKRLTGSGELDWATIPDTHPDEDRVAKRDLNREAERVLTAGGQHEKANRGTHLHALAEQSDRGTPVDEAPYGPLLDAYRDTTSIFDGYEAIEQGVVLDGLQVHGTPDRIVRYNGALYIGDLKSGSLDYPAKMAMQLGIYAHADAYYDHTTGERHPFPAVDQQRGIIIHLDPTTGVVSLRWIDIAWGWDKVQLALDVRAARADTSHLLRPLYPDALADAIRATPTPDGLVALWEQYGATWTDHHTALAAARKAELTAA